MSNFELTTLDNYDDSSLLDEVRRVALLLPEGPLTVVSFDTCSRVASSTLRRRFGGWRKVLEAAGLGNRFDDTNVRRDKHEVVSELQRVANILGTRTLTKSLFVSHSSFGHQAVTAVFGNWSDALSAASLSSDYIARRFSDDECFDNLMRVWEYLGRQPKYGEMNSKPSTINARVYARRWHGWRRALAQFVRWANQAAIPAIPSEKMHDPQACDVSNAKGNGHRGHSTSRKTSRTISVRLRFLVMRRDNFKCCQCGKTPALHAGTVLEIDHIVPWSKGGETLLENLQTLCRICNGGKSNLIFE